MNMFRKCLNWKVMAGLAVVAAGLFVLVSPTAAVAALPFLVAAICPLSMLLMMKGMGSMHKNAQGSVPVASANSSVNAAGVTQSACCTPSKPLTREEQVTQLQAELRDMQAQQEKLGAQLAQLEKPTAAVISTAPATTFRGAPD